MRREWGGIVEHASRASERGGMRLFAASFVAGACIALSFCLFPLILAIHLLGRAAEYGQDGEHEGKRVEAVWSAGALSFLCTLPFLGSMCVALFVLRSFRGIEEGIPAWALALQFAACVLGNVALAPLMAAAPLRIAQTSSMRDAIALSLARGSSRPLLTVLVGALQGALFSLPVLLSQIVGVPVGPLLAIAGSALAWAVHPVLSSGLAAPAVEAPQPLTRVALPTLLALACVVPVWLAVPPPMWQRFDERLGRASLPLGGVVDEDEEPCPIWLESEPREYVRCARTASAYPSTMVRDERTGHRIVLAMDVGGRLGIPLDDQLHRLDDTPLDRLRARTNAGLVTLLGLAALAALLAALGARSARRALGTSGPLVTTDAVLRLGEGGAVRFDGRTLTPSGSVWLETREGDGALRLDRPIPFPTLTPTVEDGAAVLLVSPKHAPRFGPRDGAAPLPESAWLADTQGIDHALALHAARGAALAMTAAILLALLAGVTAVCAI